jgi:hypothetical protein
LRPGLSPPAVRMPTDLFMLACSFVNEPVA